MSDLPKGWTSTTLGDICSKPQYGWTSKASRQGKIKYLRTTDISDGKIDWESVPFCELEPDSVEKYQIQKNDILVSRAGSVGISYRIEEIPYKTVFASYLIRFNPLKCALPQYVEYFLKSHDYWTSISESSAGIAIPNVNATKLAEIKMPLAPLNEQKRIVEKLEKLLGKVEAVQARLDKIPAILKRFRQAVLAAACSGKLTADWRLENQNLETATEIIENFKNQRLANAKNLAEKEKITAIYDFVEEADSQDLPESWRFAVLNKICNSYTYGTSTKSDKEGLVAVLRMGNIQSGKLDWTDLVYTSDKSEIEKYRLKPNSVLFNRTNSPELVGKTAIYRGEQEAIFAGYLIRINNFDCLDSEYLNCCLNTTFARDFCLQVKTDGVSQSNINAQKLGLFELAMPPLEEQKEIVRRVEDLFKFADQIEARYKKARSYTDKLTQSILAKAFRGELVPQEETDEPASVLLERIREENEQNSKISEKLSGRKSNIRGKNEQQKLFASG